MLRRRAATEQRRQALACDDGSPRRRVAVRKTWARRRAWYLCPVAMRPAALVAREGCPKPSVGAPKSDRRGFEVLPRQGYGATRRLATCVTASSEKQSSMCLQLACSAGEPEHWCHTLDIHHARTQYCVGEAPRTSTATCPLRASRRGTAQQLPSLQPVSQQRSRRWPRPPRPRPAPRTSSPRKY